MDSRRVANYLVQYFNSAGDPITNLKLQKLLYYIQVWYMVHFNGNLIFDEKPQAWVHGPVYPSVYRDYNENNGSPIIPSEPYSDEELELECKKIFHSSKDQEFIKAILSYYGGKSGFMLELMTHNEDPWKTARRGYAPIQPSNVEIDLQFASEYYKKQLSMK